MKTFVKLSLGLLFCLGFIAFMDTSLGFAEEGAPSRRRTSAKVQKAIYTIHLTCINALPDAAAIEVRVYAPADALAGLEEDSEKQTMASLAISGDQIKGLLFQNIELSIQRRGDTGEYSYKANVKIPGSAETLEFGGLRSEGLDIETVGVIVLPDHRDKTPLTCKK